MRALSQGESWFIVLMTFPPILCIFVISPMIIKQYALWEAVAGTV
jgi:hypothetical protein